MLAWLARYRAHPDPVVDAGNLIALVLGSNTPFYPLYLDWIAGHDAFPAGLLCLCVTPLFLAVPALSRRHPLAGRVLLVLAGIANTIFDTKILGESSGTELFLAPCIVLAGLLRRPGEFLLLALAALPILAFFALSTHYAPPWAHLSPPELTALFRLNAGSVGTLLFFMGLVFGGVRRETSPDKEHRYTNPR